MQKILTPFQEGYIFPAEWEKHASTWLTYPKPNESWPANFNKVCAEYNQFVKLISSGEKVNIVCDNQTHSLHLAENLDKAGAKMSNIAFHEFGSDDSWCRDHGPAFLLNRKTGERAIVKWEFNAWGSKYPSEKDNEIGNKISSLYDLKVFRPGIVMEGGSVEVNGKGTLITTKACLLNKNRNLSHSVKEIESYLSGYYGAENIIWLGEGVEGDDTDGHIDDMVRFVDNDKIITVIEEDKHDNNYPALKHNRKLLNDIRLENGKQPEISELPMPEPVYNGRERLPASYANFYICNKAVIVPIFGSKNEDKALQILQSCFTDKEVIGLYSGNVIYGLGSWHCLSQQEIAN
jgi:agmatine deiminase